jgi:2-polyprenyl-6-methoxyphenol hydroxylase-like FAD-dependent oxidoreductase
VDEAIKLGAVFRFGQEFINLRDECEAVKATIRRRDDSKEYTVKCKYLVGADGARSTVLDALGIPIIGRTINSAFNVHIKADLSQYLRNRPGSLNWILNTEAPDWSAVGNFRMVRPWREWVVSMHPAKKDNGQEFNPTEDQIKNRLYQMIGDDSVAIDILSTFRWNINDQVAESWQKGRVLCIGDAVHRHPPINGLGSNTCISDAFNLAWKLAFVLRGYANPVLLQSLTIERKPVGDWVVRRANEGMEAHRSLWALLGLTAEDRTKAMSVLEKADSQGKLARKRLRDAFDKTDAELQALGIQMNQIYVRSPATAIERNDKAPSAETDLLKEVAISTFPGYHLPHVWLAASGQSPRVSTLDLCGRGRFVVLTGLGGECWVQAAKEVSSRSGLEIGAYKIGFHCDFMDCYGDWGRVRDVEEEGVVLVRPDHFVGWRFFTASPEATALLQAALNQILGNR